MGGWTYMVRCSDDSYYIGSTSYTEVDIRVGEHNDGRFEGYTHKRRPVTLVWAEWFNDLKEAQAVERQIKGWRREKKETLIRRDWDALKVLSKRAGARHPEVAAKRPSKGDALNLNRHPEVRPPCLQRGGPEG